MILYVKKEKTSYSNGYVSKITAGQQSWTRSDIWAMFDPTVPEYVMKAAQKLWERTWESKL